MPNQGLKILLTTGVLTAAFAGLMWTTMQDGTEYYKHVDEVMVEPAAWYGKRLQVHGYAANITWKPSTLDYRFQLENNGHVIQAEYTGIVPDTFKDKAEVVATGHLDGDTLVVDHIMAKCPSKYEAKPKLGAAVDGGVAAMDQDANADFDADGAND